MAASMRKVVKNFVSTKNLLNTTISRPSWTCLRSILENKRRMCTDGTITRDPENFTPENFVDNTALDEDFKDTEAPLSFATMLRNSRFVQLGRLQNKVVIGRIFEVIDDDLYIDFGGKFMCCCPKPFKQDYYKGQMVKLSLQQFEMAATFMGSDTAVTLLEADCSLIGSRSQGAEVSRVSRGQPAVVEESLDSTVQS